MTMDISLFGNVLLLLVTLSFHRIIPVYTRVCNVGFHGINCSLPCRFPSYGFQCQLACNCTADICDHISGCIFQTVYSEATESAITNRTPESSVNKTNTSISNVALSSEKNFIAFTFAGIAFLFGIVLIVCIYKRKKFNVIEMGIECEQYEQIQSQPTHISYIYPTNESNTHCSYIYPTNESNLIDKVNEHEVESENYDTIPEENITHKEQDPVQDQENIRISTNQEEESELLFRTEDDYIIVAQIDELSDGNKEI